MKNGKYRVLLVEDQTIPTQLFEHFIQTSERYELARSIECAAFAEVYCMTGEIDIVLMDVVTADGASGLDAAEKIKKKYPHIKIIIVTSMPECSYISRAKALGAEGFWYKETGKESLISVMDRVMQGEIVYPDGLQVVNIGVAKSSEFTKKELVVLRLMTGGYSNQEIADKLGVSLNAVKKHISNMLEKTCLRSRTELAVKARETGLVILENTKLYYRRKAKSKSSCKKAAALSFLPKKPEKLKTPKIFEHFEKRCPKVPDWVLCESFLYFIRKAPDEKIEPRRRKKDETSNSFDQKQTHEVYEKEVNDYNACNRADVGVVIDRSFRLRPGRYARYIFRNRYKRHGRRRICRGRNRQY